MNSVVRLFVPVALLVALMACSRGGQEGSGRVGVTLGAGSTPQILYRSCTGERIAAVEIKQFVQGKPEAETRWKIEAANEPAAFQPVAIGEVPPGFKEVVPLDALPTGSSQFIAILETELDGQDLKTSANFIPDDLEAGRVVTSAFDSVPQSEFDEQSRCPGNK